MKLKQILFGGLLCAAAFSTGQNTITFQPHYRAGQTLRYRMDMSMTAPQAMKMNMVIAQHVTKVYPNGDADISVTTEGGSMTTAGRTNPFPKTPAQSMRVNKYGQPMKGASANAMGAMGFDPSSMSAMMPHRPLHAGEVIPIHQAGKNGANVNGTLKVASISGGVAKLIMNSTVAMGGRGSMKMNMTALVDAASSQMRSMDGVMSGFMGQPNATAHIHMVRI